MKFVLDHAIKESLRRKIYYFLCLFACFLVSLVSLIAKTVVAQGSVIFLMIAERRYGERDIILYTYPFERKNNKLNFTDYYFDYAFINNSKFIEKMSNFTDENNPSLTSTVRIILKGNDLKHGNVINIVLINTTREKEIELGRNYPFHPLKRGECIIHETLKNSIINDTLLMIINPKEFLFNHILLNYYENEYNENINKISEINTEMYFNCKVIKVINHYYGKLRDASKNIIFMEMDNFFQHFSYFIPKTINELFPDYKKKLNNINPNHFATQLIVNFPKNRIINYIESDYHKLLKKAISFANNLVININSLNHMWIEMPLIRGMQRYNYGSVLLNL